MSNKLLPNAFQIPNAIVDDFLQLLSGNEMKLYLIIVRKTKGWNKKFDGISHSQFIKFSGISSRNTIAKSLQRLIELDLIQEHKQNGTYSLFYLSDPYQKLSMSENEHANDTPLPKIEHDPYQKLSIQTDTNKEEEERRIFKLNNFEDFYAWLPKTNIKTAKWHKQRIKQNLLNDDPQTIENFNSYLNERESINSKKTMSEIAKTQFELLKTLITTKTANEIYQLDKNKSYQSLFEIPTNNFINQKKGLVELSSSLDNESYHPWLLQELQKQFMRGYHEQ